jgi:fatty-acyl-CoA synthase
MQNLMMNAQLTLMAMLERTQKVFGKVAIVSRQQDRSLLTTCYGTLYERACKLAKSLTKAGLARGDRVASLMWSHAAHLEAYFGVPASGAVLHTLNARLHPDELAYVVNHAGDRILLVDDVLLELYEKFREKTNIERVVVVPTKAEAVPKLYEDYEGFLKLGQELSDYRRVDEHEAAVLCFTSGTTGLPKGVLYSHRSLVLHSLCASLPDCHNLSQVECVFPAVPMFHVNAWGMPYAATLVGAKLVLPGAHLDPISVLELLEHEQVTRTAGVPTIWAGVLDLLDEEPGRWKLHPALRVIAGGSAVPKQLFRRFARHGISLIQGWGMTETGPLATTGFLKSYLRELPDDQQLAILAKQGLPLPLIEIRGMANESEIPWDGRNMGELEIRGPWVARSYYGSPEQQTEKWTPGGWFCTGDVVTIDDEGYVNITDRMKDLIKSGGEWISSVDLENALLAHPSVWEAAVVAIPHPKWQERPVAVVVLKTGETVTAEELRIHLGKTFSRWQLPDAFVFLSEIPHTSVGKIQKSRIRAMFSNWQWEGDNVPKPKSDGET